MSMIFFVCVHMASAKTFTKYTKKKTFTKKGKHFLSKITEEQQRVK